MTSSWLFAIKIVALIIAFVFAVRIEMRNARRDFKPAGRAHLEMFLANFPCGYIAGLLLPIPDFAESFGVATLVALGVGLVGSFNAPRRHRYMREKYPNIKW